MATKKETRHDIATEAQTIIRKQGGWVTFPFLAGSLFGLGVALSGLTGNLIVYLIKEFNVKSIDAAQISNIVNGCLNIAPVAGAIISDAYFGCFPVVAVSTFISLLSAILFTVTATTRSLRPPPCSTGSHPCQMPSSGQLAVLYSAIALVVLGTGGSRFNAMTYGAGQFDKAVDQDVYFNWHFVFLYASMITGSTVIVYVEDNLGWGIGFGICVAVNVVSLAALMLGRQFYRRVAVEESPYTGIARVVVAAVKKRKLGAPVDGEGYYYGTNGVSGKITPLPPTSSFRCLNGAASITDGDTNTDGTIAKPWSLCSVQQVEDLKSLLRISPLWTTSFFVGISIGTQGSLSVLQALTVDRSLGPHFTVPAGSLIVSSFAAVIVALTLLDRLLFPLLRRLTGRAPSPLQRIGAGHVLNWAGMAASALVERRRAGLIQAHQKDVGLGPGWTVPMSVLWLMLPLMITGLGEAMHFPGQVALYYREFPDSMKSSATGMIAMLVAIGFYLSTAVIDTVRRLTVWLPDDINKSKLENVYWLLVVAGAINFGYFLVCATVYRYKVVEADGDGDGDDARLARSGSVS